MSDIALSNLKDCLDYALSKGASDASIKSATTKAFSYGVRMGEPETLERSESTALMIRLYKGQKKQVIRASNFDFDALKGMIDDTLPLMHALPEDPYVGLASKDQILKDIPNLDIADPSEPDEKAMMAMMNEAEKAALAHEKVTNSKGGEIAWERFSTALVASNGFEGSFEGTSASYYLQPVAGAKDGMQVDFDYSQAVYFDDLKNPEEVGRRAAEKVAAKLNPRKVKTGSYPVFFDRDIAGTIFSHLMEAISGDNIARGISFLKNSMGEQLFADNITLYDEPFKARGLGTRPFDGEGMGFTPLEFIKDGILQYWLMDLGAARKLDMVDAPHQPLRGTGSTTNLRLNTGDLSPAEFFKKIGTGFLATDLMSRPKSLVNGDYSVGASGFWIENGEIAYPVHEATISGNLRDMFKALQPANDITTDQRHNYPTIYLGELSLGGE